MVSSEVKPLVIFGCHNCSRSLNVRRILTFEKFPDPDPEPDSNILEEERSQCLKK